MAFTFSSFVSCRSVRVSVSFQSMGKTKGTSFRGDLFFITFFITKSSIDLQYCIYNGILFRQK